MLVKAEALPVGLGNSRAKLAGISEPTSRLTLWPNRLSAWRLTNRPSQPRSFSTFDRSEVVELQSVGKGLAEPAAGHSLVKLREVGAKIDPLLEQGIARRANPR